MNTTPIREATGASIRPHDLKRNFILDIRDFGAAENETPIKNTAAINSAIDKASVVGGGTVLIPKGTYLVYTIRLRSNVNLHLADGAIVAAAKTEIKHSPDKQIGEGGNYDEPEVNPYLGIQDHGHTYFANSLLYGIEIENVMISGKGLFTGGRFDENGILEYVLHGDDPAEPTDRLANGHHGEWFGNKGIALVRSKNIVLKDFSITIGGHFAIITEGCENLYVEDVLVDTTRDAFDIDCCKDVTVLRTTCNSLTDDGLCLKASFGAGIFKPLENVLIEDCFVCGYDAGSVYAKKFTRDKLIALDRCGPTGRVKFGTEATCGYTQVTIRRVHFERSRGFCMEATDCSSLTDVIFEDCTLDNVSSSPIFIRAGERARFPVTGNSKETAYPTQNDVRLDQENWVLPADSHFHTYSAKRFSPHYNRERIVSVDGHSAFRIVDETNPVATNPVNFVEQDGKFYQKKWDASSQSYVPDFASAIPAVDLPLFANAIGYAEMATVKNVCIRNVKITNADPRYPILLMGLTDSHLKNIQLENIDVEFRGGLSMEHAVEQRQLNTEWKFSQFHAPVRIQTLPWLVNTFFLKNEGLLPRVDWDGKSNSWKDDPYNVPELPDVYPESSNWGILPAYGLFAKHVDDLVLKNLKITYKVPDGRHALVFDDAKGILIDGLCVDCMEGQMPIALVEDAYRRHTNAENVPNQPYFSTKVEDLEIKEPIFARKSICDNQCESLNLLQGSANTNASQSNKDSKTCAAAANSPETARNAPSVARMTAKEACMTVSVNAPAPGTPRDSFYDAPTVACPETGYQFAIPTENYPLPRTVFRPFFRPLPPIAAKVGEKVSFCLEVRNPATEVPDASDKKALFNEQSLFGENYCVGPAKVELSFSCENLPEGAFLDAVTGAFSWTPKAAQTGDFTLVFIVDDGVIPEQTEVKIRVS